MRLRILEQEKTPYLFSSAQLAEILEITPSMKTRLAIIAMLGPRLIDPRAKVDYFLNLFRFSEEKERVQEVLKARTQFLSAGAYRQPSLIVTNTNTEGHEHQASKAFVGIKGFAQARTRAPVSKPSPKAVIIPIEPIPVPIIAPKISIVIPKNNYSNNNSYVRHGSESNMVTREPVKIPTDFVRRNSARDMSAHASHIDKSHSSHNNNNNNNNAESTPEFPSPASEGSGSLYELCSVGKVQRMIKSFSKFIPVYNMNSEVDDDEINGGSGCYGHDGTPRNPNGTRRIGINFTELTDESSVLKMNRNLSVVTVTEEEDLRISECTSVEGGEVADENELDNDSVHTWRQSKLRKSKSVLGDEIARLSFERRKGLFEGTNYNCDTSTNESGITDKESDFDTTSPVDMLSPNKRRSSATSYSAISRDENHDEKPHRRGSETFKHIMEHFRVLGVGHKKSNDNSHSSIIAKELILYQNMPEEGSVDVDAHGEPLFRYYELVRMNYVKQYKGIIQADLIYSMVDSDFYEHLGITKVSKI